MKRLILPLVALALAVAGGAASNAANLTPPTPLPLQGKGGAFSPLFAGEGLGGRSPHPQFAIFGANHRANTDATTYAQQEPSIAVNPTNPLNIIASAKDERTAPAPNTNTKKVWEYSSSDGGVTWTNVQAPVLSSAVSFQSDPVNIFRDDGVAYACYLGYAGTSSNLTGIYVTRSTDGGLTWANTVVAVPEGATYSVDKQWLAVDNNPASPYYHRLYLTWTDFGACNGCIHAVYSSDGGTTWSTPTFQLSTNGSSQQFSMPTVLWNGDVFVSWLNNSTIVARTSSDGGVTWGPERALAAMNTNLAMTGRNWRISPIPVAAADRSAPARINIVWNDGRNNATDGVDIYTIRSADGGATWTAPTRLNDDRAGVIQQAEPWIAAGPNGVFHAIWYDEREDSTASILFQIYYSYSADGGATWSANQRISDAPSDLNVGMPAGPGWNQAAGDYINLAVTDTDIYAAWTDTRNGNEDIYMVRGQFTPDTQTATATLTVTGTPPTATSTATGTVPATTTATRTATATSTPGITVTPSATPAVCPIRFSDVTDPTAYYYQPVYYLACRGVVSGYADGTFRPFNLTTRAQLVKISVLGLNLPIQTPAGGYTFSDVPPTDGFFRYVETAAARGIIGGYACGAPGEGCDPARRSYFRPAASVTRGQAAKIVVLAAGWPVGNPATPTFSDVPPGSAFYPYVETAACRGVITGYADGTFLPANNATRGQIAKIVTIAAGNPACGAAPAIRTR